MTPPRLATLGLCLAIAAGGAPVADAICLPFGDREVDQLEADGLREAGDEARAVEAAIARARQRGERLVEAQLWAATATRRIPLGSPERVREAIAASRGALAALPPAARGTGAARRVAQRLVLDDAALAVTPEALRAARDSVEALLRTLGDDEGNARTCALLVRSLKQSDLGDQQSAAADAMTAYRLAEAGGYGFARADAAIMLATAYRRAGLTGPASRYIADAIARASQVGPPGMRARARYVQAQVHLDAQQFDAALDSLREARQVWTSLGNDFGVLASEQTACAIAVERGDTRSAGRACALDEAALQRAGRPDMVRVQRAYGALVALDRGATAEAARLVDSAVAVGAAPSPNVEARLLAIRARVREAQGRWREALADTARVVELERLKRAAERVHATALLEASLVAERMQQDNRLLRIEAAQAAAALRQQTLVRNLWAAAAIAALVAGVSLVALLVFLRRRERRERRARAIVSTLAANSPDALLLVGPDGQVQAANRGLFGGAAPAPGVTLADALPAAARVATLGALARARTSREVEAAEVAIDEASGPRTYELKCAPIVDDGQVVGATLRATDVSDTRRIERLAAALASRERVRVAGELHEGLGQELAGVAMLLSSLARRSQQGGRTDTEALDAAAAALMRSVEQTRGLAREVAPVVVARRSLRDALLQLAAAPQGPGAVRLHYDSTAPLADAVADGLFRIVREVVDRLRDAGHRGIGLQVGDAVDGQLVVTFEVDAAVPGDATTGDAARGDAATRLAGLDVAMLEHRVRSLGATLDLGHPRDGILRIAMPRQA